MPSTLANKPDSYLTLPGPMLLASLANGAYYASAVFNETTLTVPHLDVLVSFSIKLGASGVAAGGVIGVFAYGSIDGGTTYTEGLAGTVGLVTSSVQSPTNLRFINNITANVNAAQVVGGPWSVASAFYGILPDHWGIVIFNNTSAAFDATETNHKKLMQGFFAQAS